MIMKNKLNYILKPKSDENIIKDLSKLYQKEKDEKLLVASYGGQQDVVRLLI